MLTDQSVKELREAFYQVYDATQCRLLLEKMRSGRSLAGMSYLGEGAFFRAYRLNTGKDLDLTLKLIAPERLKALPSTWQASMHALRVLRLDLIPPMEVVGVGEELLGYVMPYGEVLALNNSRADQLQARLQQMLQALRRHNLRLLDMPQFAQWRSTLFITDWSDVQAL